MSESFEGKVLRDDSPIRSNFKEKSWVKRSTTEAGNKKRFNPIFKQGPTVYESFTNKQLTEDDLDFGEAGSEDGATFARK